MDFIYLDHNSTTPVLPEVVEAMQPYWSDGFGNPASAHAFGRRARQAIESAREQVADLLGAASGEVLFTSGATEANNLALHGLMRLAPPAAEVIVSPIEHPSVAEPLEQMRKAGRPLHYLKVDSAGVVVRSSLAEFLQPAIRLVTVMLANNETGAIQPVQELAAMCAAALDGTVHFHCDAVQAVGKMPVSFLSLGVATLSLSAHKFHGPKGIGALLVRKGVGFHPLVTGGHQQKGRRPGTEPVPLAVGLARALEIACRDQAARMNRVRVLRTRFLQTIRSRVGSVKLNGPEEEGLPHTVNLSFEDCRGDSLLMLLDLAGVACSTGSACSSGSLLPSPTLKAMGCRPEHLSSAMRFSLSHVNTEQEVDDATNLICEAVSRLRTLRPDTST